MRQRYDVLGFGLIVLGCAIFAALGTADVLFTDQSWLFRWQGFIGALIGAAGTLAAGWLAWQAVQHQINADRERMLADRVEGERLLTEELTDYAEGMAAAWRVLVVLGEVSDEQKDECTKRARDATCYMAERLSRPEPIQSYRAMAQVLGWERRNSFTQLIRRLEEFGPFNDFDAHWDLEDALILMRSASCDFEWCLPATSEFFGILWRRTPKAMSFGDYVERIAGGLNPRWRREE
jgi:hypothetical protein